MCNKLSPLDRWRNYVLCGKIGLLPTIDQREIDDLRIANYTVYVTNQIVAYNPIKRIVTVSGFMLFTISE